MAASADENELTPKDQSLAPGAQSSGTLHSDEPIKLDERIQGLLGERLSTYYGALVAEPVPAKFLELLSRLDQAESGE